MNRITGVYTKRSHVIAYRKGEHTYIFEYHHRLTLVRHVASVVERCDLTIADAEKIYKLAADAEWQTKGV